MSLRTLLVLIVLLAAAVFCLRFLGRTPPPVAAPETTARLMPVFGMDAVRELVLSCDGPPVTLRRNSSPGWQLVQPVRTEADPRRVNELISAIQDAKVHKVIAEGKVQLAAFGLGASPCTLRIDLGSSATPLTLRLGRSSPVGSERYAATNDTRVVLTDGALYAALARGPETFREKRLLPLDAGDVTRITLARPSGRLALTLTEGGCRVDAPVKDAGSVSACASLARALTSIAVSAPYAARPPGDGDAKRRIRVEVEAKGAKTSFVAFVAAAGTAGKRVAWNDSAALCGLVDESAAAELERAPDSYRDLRIVSWSSQDVRGVSIDRGASVVRVTRTGESAPWTGAMDGTPFTVGGSRVDALLERLRGLTAEGLLDAAPTTSKTATIAVSGAKGELAHVVIGPAAKTPGMNGEFLWLTTPSRPGVVFRVAASSLGPLPKGPADFAPAEVKP